MQDENYLYPGLILRYTRHWIHYGAISFVILCTVVAALRGVASQLNSRYPYTGIVHAIFG